MVAAQPLDLLDRPGAVEREQHRHRIHRRREVAVLAVQRLGRDVGGHRLPVARERQRGHRLPGRFEALAQPSVNVRLPAPSTPSIAISTARA